MRLSEAVDTIEGCESLDALKRILQRIAEDYGFASYAFVSGGETGEDSPLVIATTHKQWDDDYRANDFIAVDPVFPVVRRTNFPFTWGDVRFPLRIGRRKSGAARTMDAARDHGFTEGLVVPFHHLDGRGRFTTAVCGFFWRDKKHLFVRVDRKAKSELHIILIYWAQSVIRLSRKAPVLPLRPGIGGDDQSVLLTDRERSALGWAARGKTVDETAVILAISGDTVQFHLKNAVRKLDAMNKTQAVVKAIKLGLIEV